MSTRIIFEDEDECEKRFLQAIQSVNPPAKVGRPKKYNEEELKIQKLKHDINRKEAHQRLRDRIKRESQALHEIKALFEAGKIVFVK